MTPFPSRPHTKLLAGYFSLSAVALGSTISLPTAAQEEVQVFDNQITVQEVKAAQKGWCDALLTISQAYQKGGHTAAKAKASAIIDAAYG